MPPRILYLDLQQASIHRRTKPSGIAVANRPGGSVRSRGLRPARGYPRLSDPPEA